MIVYGEFWFRRVCLGWVLGTLMRVKACAASWNGSATVRMKVYTAPKLSAERTKSWTSLISPYLA